MVIIIIHGFVVAKLQVQLIVAHHSDIQDYWLQIWLVSQVARQSPVIIISWKYNNAGLCKIRTNQYFLSKFHTTKLVFVCYYGHLLSYQFKSNNKVVICQLLSRTDLAEYNCTNVCIFFKFLNVTIFTFLWSRLVSSTSECQSCFISQLNHTFCEGLCMSNSWIP